MTINEKIKIDFKVPDYINDMILELEEIAKLAKSENIDKQKVSDMWVEKASELEVCSLMAHRNGKLTYEEHLKLMYRYDKLG
ncbi:hypothetical protein [Oceanivirga miroungae]|uniref:Uncharacterized protein n=1 Tax=Oceanivirga miroungae TaxID=1130046 RepID=A0A6I8M5E0_9FUSO|nr:hypothetical protein [Oceanivirga miroungae]VWL85138.1 hypothetical protein OMES3154_00422 [Oceanivirga miroungae]